MSLPSDGQLELLSRSELIVLVKELIGAVEMLQARVAELEAEVAQYREPPIRAIPRSHHRGMRKLTCPVAAASVSGRGLATGVRSANWWMIRTR